MVRAMGQLRDWPRDLLRALIPAHVTVIFVDDHTRLVLCCVVLRCVVLLCVCVTGLCHVSYIYILSISANIFFSMQSVRANRRAARISSKDLSRTFGCNCFSLAHLRTTQHCAKSHLLESRASVSAPRKDIQSRTIEKAN